MQPDRILSYASDGLTAALYRGRYAPPSDRIVIMLGGSDGSYALTQTYAAVFAENGLTALAVPYLGQPHLAQGLAQIAVEKAQATHPDIARIAIKTMMANQKFKNALTPESLAWVRELLRG